MESGTSYLTVIWTILFAPWIILSNFFSFLRDFLITVVEHQPVFMDVLQ